MPMLIVLSLTDSRQNVPDASWASLEKGGVLFISALF